MNPEQPKFMLIKIFSSRQFIKLQSTRNCHFPFHNGNRRTCLELQLVMAQEALRSSKRFTNSNMGHTVFTLDFQHNIKRNIERC